MRCTIYGCDNLALWNATLIRFYEIPVLSLFSFSINLGILYFVGSFNLVPALIKIAVVACIEASVHYVVGDT